MINSQDRIQTYGSLQFVFNKNGDLVSKTDTSTSQTTSYVYDVFGQLKSVTLPDSTQITYLTDGERKRVVRRVNGSMTHGYVYNEQGQLVAELTSGGALSSRFVYASQAHSPDYMIKGGVNFKFVKDHLGSVRLVVNAANCNVAQRIDYDEWGVVLNDTNPGFQPFGFAGGIYDHQTGLVRFGARDYDAEIGRWTAKEPLRFVDGTNLYLYVGGDPINTVDVTGKFGESFGYGGCVVGEFFRGSNDGPLRKEIQDLEDSIERTREKIRQRRTKKGLDPYQCSMENFQGDLGSLEQLERALQNQLEQAKRSLPSTPQSIEEAFEKCNQMYQPVTGRNL